MQSIRSDKSSTKYLERLSWRVDNGKKVKRRKKEGPTLCSIYTVVQYCSMRLFNISDQGETDLCIEELAASMHNRYSFLAWEDNHDF